MSRSQPWYPPPGPDAELQPAGRWWDCVKAPVYLGDRALSYLGKHSGAVIRDPWSHYLYWFVPTGSANRWKLPYITVLGPATYVMVPPAGLTRAPSLHWAVSPTDGRRVTDTGRLHAALKKAIRVSYGPRKKAVA